MKLFHGTSRQAWADIQAQGVQAPSYWGTREQAQEYADSFGEDGVVLRADIDEGSLGASVLVAQALLEAGETDALPDQDDLADSLEFLGGVVCHDLVREVAIIDVPPAPRPGPKR